jgi:hypothetical protein
MTTKPTEARRGMSTLDLEAAYAEFVPKMSGKANASHKFAFGAGVVARARWQARRAALAATPAPCVSKSAESETQDDLSLTAAPIADSDPNAPWLALAHTICADAGIPAGKITWRLEVLHGLLQAPVAQPLSAQDREILEAVRRELDDEQPGNAPGHAHRIVGIWDSDNGAKAGKPCAWCLTWQKFTALIDAHGIKGEVKS